MNRQLPDQKRNKESSCLPGVFTARKKDGTVYYRASFTWQSRHISLGSYETPERAHSAYKEALTLMHSPSPALISDFSQQALSFEKWVILSNLRDNRIYFSTPIYIRNNYFSYFLDPKTELKFSIDDLFYYSSHKILRRKGHLFVSDYGMQVTILSRYGIKSYGIPNKDYRLLNGDPYDFRYENIEILNPFHGVSYVSHYGKMKYQARIHIRGNYVIGYYRSGLEAAIAYNKAIDILSEHGCRKSFLTNYVDQIPASRYADIYRSIKISPKIRQLQFK